VRHDPEAAASLRDHKVLLYGDDRQFVRAVGESAFGELIDGGFVVLMGSTPQLAAAEEWIELSRDAAARPSALGRYVTIDAEAVADELAVAEEPARAFEEVLSKGPRQVRPRVVS
jgi:hypothetical protein